MLNSTVHWFLIDFCYSFCMTCFNFVSALETLQKDKRTGRPKIWFYRDKETNEPKGDATITYEDPHAALAPVEWFNNKEFLGNIIGVFIAESKNKDDTNGSNFVGAEENIKDIMVLLEEVEAEAITQGKHGNKRETGCVQIQGL